MTRFLRPSGRRFPLCMLLAAGAVNLQGQSTVAFAPGGQQLVLLDFSTFPLGRVVPPASGGCLSVIPVCDIRGQLEVVMQDGKPMLRASGRSSFVVRLPQRLPADFTLEFDLIPMTCCQPEDLSFEGVADIAYGQTAVSANVLWHHDHHAIVGGVKDQGFSMPMPAKLAAVVRGSLTNIEVSFRGSSLTMYTNSEEVYSVQREFVRGTVLRVFLGGQNDTDQAVYLARLRIGAGPPLVVASAAPIAPVTAILTPAPTATAVAVAPQNPTVTANAPAAASGPVSRTNPAASSSTALFAPAAPRTITLSAFSASGIRIASPTITMPVYVAAGVVSAVAPRTVALPNVTSTGEYSIAVSRRMALGAYAGTGTASSASGLQPRTIVLSAVNLSGVFGTSLPRKITLPVLTASGPTTSSPPRKITLPAIMATGILGLVAPRTITLVGWTATGTRTP